jgi:hypothetical protein
MNRSYCMLSSCLAALALGAAATEARAQSGFLTRPTAGVFGGFSVPRGSLKTEADLGWHAGALAKIRVYNNLDARIDGAYVKLGGAEIVGTDATVSTDPKLTMGTLSALLNLGPDSAEYHGDNSVSPWLIGGFGIYQVDFQAVCTGSCATFLDPGVKSHAGFNVGTGGTVPVAGIRTFFEFRYHRIFREDSEGGSRIILLASVGVKIR